MVSAVMINNRGSALAEVAISLPVLTMAVAGVMAATYLCVAHAWLKDAAEEAALCVAEKVSAYNCRQELKRKTSLALPIGNYNRLNISRGINQITVSYDFQSLKTHLRNEIYLQLPVGKRKVGSR